MIIIEKKVAYGFFFPCARNPQPFARTWDLYEGLLYDIILIITFGGILYFFQFINVNN